MVAHPIEDLVPLELWMDVQSYASGKWKQLTNGGASASSQLMRAADTFELPLELKTFIARVPGDPSSVPMTVSRMPYVATTNKHKVKWIHRALQHVAFADAERYAALRPLHDPTRCWNIAAIVARVIETAAVLGRLTAEDIRLRTLLVDILSRESSRNVDDNILNKVEAFFQFDDSRWVGIMNNLMQDTDSIGILAFQSIVSDIFERRTNRKRTSNVDEDAAVAKMHRRAQQVGFETLKIPKTPLTKKPKFLR